jgi:predicted secreted protein
MRARPGALALAVALVGTALSAPGSALANDLDQEPARMVVEVTEDDAGSRVELRSGDLLQVTLACQPGTGYSWVAADPAPPFLSLESEEFLDGDGTPGGQGAHRLVFVAGDEGPGDAAVLRLDLRRPWEQDVPPTASFELTVVRVD